VRAAGDLDRGMFRLQVIWKPREIRGRSEVLRFKFMTKAIVRDLGW